jgi:23S rRNA (uracil1939-C5)-methyltransferase
MLVEIEKMGFAGSGIGHIDDGRVVFVKKTVPGDVVEIKLLDDKKDFVFGKVSGVIKPSDDRIEPDCPYFYSCGGCEHQNISYNKQLEIKQSLIDESLVRNGIDIQAKKIIPGSNQHFFYRNSIRFMFDLDSKNHLHIARHAYPDERRLVQVDKCLLQSETSNLIAKKIVDFVNANVSNKKSFWQLKVREGKKTTEFMIEIITSSHDLPGEKGIIENLKSIQGIKSIYHTIAPAKSLLNLKRRLIFGLPVIYEKIGGYTFQISPESFFQTNSEGVKNLYDIIKKISNVEMGDEVVDLFCGTGSIGIYLSTLAKKVTGIEVVTEAIRDAKDNAKINKIFNAEFINDDVKKFLQSGKKLDKKIIIVDPPRSGLKKELVLLLSKINFKRLIYVSCNPATFARDLKYFMEKGIDAKKIQPVDMFPQTHHIELVAELKNKADNLSI